MLACLCELATLLLDLREQARILDRQHRLGGKGLEQVDGVRSELARRLAADNQRADHLAGSHERHQQPRTVAGTQNGVVRRRGWRLVQIGYLAGFVPFGRQTDGCGNFGMHVPNARYQFIAHAECRAKLELPSVLIEDVNGASFGAGNLRRLGDDGIEHDLQVERGVDRL